MLMLAPGWIIIAILAYILGACLVGKFLSMVSK